MRKIYKKLMLLLDARQKKQMVGIVFMMLIGGLLETFGIALIVPLMEAISKPEDLHKSRKFRVLCDLLNLDVYDLSSSDLIKLTAVIMFSIMVIIVIKNIFLFFMNKVQLRFVYTNQFATSRRMMINFMQRPYEYYLNADTSVIQRNITSDVNNMYGLILSSLQLISEIIVFVSLVIYLLMEDAKMTVSLASLLVAMLLIIKYKIKPIMSKAGQENQDYYSGLYKWIDESVTGIKEIKIANKENFFINGYADCGAGYVNAVQKYNLYNSTPRLLIESVAIVGMIGYMLISILYWHVDVKDLISPLTVLAAAAARLLPSANRINNYLTSIAYFEPFLMNVSDNLQQEINDSSISYNSDDYKKKLEVEKIPVNETILLKDITYKYPNSDKYVLEHADMEVPVGKSVGIVGTSGAGKTTIVDVMLGLLQTESGHIYADGTDVMSNYPGWLKNIGYIPQTIFMLDSTIRKNVAFGYADEDIDDEKVWQALKEASLDEYVRSLPEGLDTGIGERGIRLSGGQRQRIGIARALFEDPEVLVLDEATSALDNETEAAIMDSINKLHGRKTLVIIAHRLQTIEKCDMVYNIKDGKAVVDRK
ncbi:ABC-type multidrug transport system, ATPase and permease component [Butyrivibrio hungatei]|uniref:ABC-type multidrug transport system, ATPase and permease component n=1 Tax=Butyrivibrio hungatei TaxID=185008 RepID=A0A1G5CCN3_9FIRM|nr:ABC transporter ATP-binding protein [Butyrivibrio hungatei]SCY00183.1 ABC-type multidrug transport system, ATPase and permease component [Butyrivibrio hungatei]